MRPWVSFQFLFFKFFAAAVVLGAAASGSCRALADNSTESKGLSLLQVVPSYKLPLGQLAAPYRTADAAVRPEKDLLTRN